ncbi:MAG TPA: peptidoglycan-associated lipoprotein Pal [candidate division Zixibacteria bacterium]|nr:peptidoglycan-associated lipoprotein Pal [candidate division Zixibacteria bacterium]HOD66869.1 peptidoglycan-associated lipoprotein Pal [candidate division Zixibacteria bacterium]HPM37455.1 peptidoglycan-associated lipoprotein Pal [candidate division Zixibacteria bacterium]
MKKFAWITMIGLALVALTLTSCGKKQVAEEAPVTQPVVTPADTATPPPPPPPPPAPKTLTNEQLEVVYFDFDKYNLRPDAKSSLDRNFALLQEFPNAIVELQGHCDERGTVEYNLALGERRAKSVQTYLIGLGIDPARLKTVSFGKERPAVPGHDESAWAKNRRCEFHVLSQ